MNSLSAEPRYSSIIHLAPGAPGQSRQDLRCSFTSLDAKRLTLLTKDPISLFRPVSVEHNDALFLGEVILCIERADNQWTVEVRVEQILSGLESLVSLRARLLGETTSNTRELVYA